MPLLRILVTTATTINIAGVLGLGWFVAGMLVYDSVLVLEILGCLVLMALLAAITAGGLALNRRGKTKTAIALLSVGVVPTAVVYGFLVYLEINPIDWR
jgi:hypothetical protein